jgi:acetyl esterase/lipase
MGWAGWTLTALLVLAVVAFGVWRWATATGSAGMLEWIDARFARERGAELAVRAQYGSDPAQHLELWVPEGRTDQPWPLIVFYHGGGWHSGRPADYRFVARTFAEHGLATALVGYRLVPEGRFPAMLEDSAAGLAWLVRNAPQHGVAAERAVLAGHSAGAYNAVMLALDPQWLAKARVPAGAVAGVVGLAGPYDFYPFTGESGRNALGHVQPAAATQPITFARGDTPPLLLLTGGADDVVRPRNSLVLDRAMRAAGGRSAAEVFDGMGHAGIIMALSRPFDQGGKVTQPVIAFAREQLAAPTSASVQGEGG